MSTSRVEDILKEIARLPSSERLRLTRLLAKPQKTSSSRDRLVVAAPAPDSTRELQWLVEHASEYAGQWVAIVGDRLIAHGRNSGDVFDAADADGAHLPLVTFVEDPEICTRVFEDGDSTRLPLLPYVSNVGIVIPERDGGMK